MASLTILIIRCILSLIGQITNGSLVYLTWKTNTMRTPFNILIATDALSMFIYLFSQPIALLIYFLFNGQQIALSSCFFYQFIPMTAVQFNRGAICLVVVDRFLGVFFSFWYTKANKNVHLTAQFMLFIPYFAFIFYAEIMACFFVNSENKVSCSPVDLYGTLYKQSLSTFMLVMLIFAISLYALIWAKIRYFKRVHAQSVLDTERISKSIIAIICSVGIGNCISTVISVFAAKFTADQQAVLFEIAFISNVVTGSCHPVLLFLFSTDYKKAYKKIFSKGNQNHQTNQIVTIQSSIKVRSTNTLTILN